MIVMSNMCHLLILLTTCLTMQKTSQVMHRRLPDKEDSPQGMFLISTGLAQHKDYYRDIHGLYRLTNTSYNYAPVFKKGIGNFEEGISMFLFLDSDGYWEVSPDLGGSNQFLLSGGKDQPLPPVYIS